MMCKFHLPFKCSLQHVSKMCIVERLCLLLAFFVLINFFQDLEGMESFLLTSHIVCFQGSLRGLVAAMSGNVDCVKILQRKKRTTEDWNLHSASIVERPKSWEVLLRACHDYMIVGLRDRYFCISCIQIRFKGQCNEGYTNLYFHAIILIHVMHFSKGKVQISMPSFEGQQQLR